MLPTAQGKNLSSDTAIAFANSMAASAAYWVATAADEIVVTPEGDGGVDWRSGRP